MPRALPRPLPVPDAERLTVGAVLADWDRAGDVFAVLGADDFGHSLCAAVFRVARSLWDRFQPGSAADVYREFLRLRDAGESRHLWDVSANLAGDLAGLLESVPTGAEGVYHAGLVKRAADRRRARAKLLEAVRDLEDGRDAGEVLADLTTGV